MQLGECHVDGRGERCQRRDEPRLALGATQPQRDGETELVGFILTGRYPLPSLPGVIPLSDGAGEVVAVGEAVTRVGVGERVTGSYWPRWHDGRLRPELRD
jgi:hypothetical protein